MIFLLEVPIRLWSHQDSLASSSSTCLFIQMGLFFVCVVSDAGGIAGHSKQHSAEVWHDPQRAGSAQQAVLQSRRPRTGAPPFLPTPPSTPHTPALSYHLHTPSLLFSSYFSTPLVLTRSLWQEATCFYLYCPHFSHLPFCIKAVHFAQPVSLCRNAEILLPSSWFSEYYLSCPFWLTCLNYSGPHLVPLTTFLSEIRIRLLLERR